MIENILEKINFADCIQMVIFIALIWYSWETHKLKQWQKKQVQLTLLGLDMRRVKNHAEGRGNPTPYGEEFPIIIRKIYEQGKFDSRVLYSKAFHRPFTLRGKILFWLRNKFNKYYDKIKKRQSGGGHGGVGIIN